MSPKAANSLPESSEIVECAVEDDIDQLFRAIDVGGSRQCCHKSAMKRPLRSVTGLGPSGVGISKSASLKEAHRGLSISQASSMAAVMKRTSRRPSESSRGVIEKCELGRPVIPIEGNAVEVSLVAERSKPVISNEIAEISEKVSTAEIVPISDEDSTDARGACKGREDKIRLESHWLSNVVKTSSEKAIDLSKRSLRSRNFAKKIMPSMALVSDTNVQAPDYFVGKGLEKLEKILMGSNITTNAGLHSDAVGTATSKRVPIPHSFSKTKSAVIKADERSQSRENEAISQSSKSSMGEFSSSSISYSEESICLAGLNIGRRPHMSTDLRWEAINYSKKKQNGNLGLKHFKLLRKVGCVYVSELVGSGCFFAVKVMNDDILKSGDTARARREKEIVGVLDHPFLPTLYADFTMGKFACLVMDYCPCGNLHMLRQKQVTKSFTEQAARFYAAEVLLAVEYLHMLGVVYRDLKPENILIREDGHIMLSNFELSFRSAFNNNPTLLESSSTVNETNSETSCLGPFCLDPTFQLSCLTPRFLSAAARSRKPKPGPTSHIVVEPTAARSNSFSGPTHEYLAPEILRGECHGSAVDWWSFGILLYELIYGATPFKGLSNEETASNVAMQRLKFPQRPMVSSQARDLIGRLLEKEPKNRMGSTKGAAEIKAHPFFEGLNWALLRRETPPEVPKWLDLGGDGDIDFEMF